MGNKNRNGDVRHPCHSVSAFFGDYVEPLLKTNKVDVERGDLTEVRFVKLLRNVKERLGEKERAEGGSTEKDR